MTNDELVKMLHLLADKVSEMLDKPIFKGSLPLISTMVRPDDPDEPVLKLTVGAEFIRANEETFNGG